MLRRILAGTSTAIVVAIAIVSSCSDAAGTAAMSTPPPPLPPPGTSPLPGASDVILMDLRQSLQQQTTVTGALNLFDPVHNSPDVSATQPSAGAEGWSFSTNIDGNGTHALVCNYIGAVRDHDCFARQAWPSHPTEVFIQWKGRFGRMATDAASNGAVNAFAWDPAHGFKRVLIHRPGDGDRLDFDGSDPDNGIIPHIENADRNWIREGSLTGWTFRTPVGGAPFTTTLYFKTASTNTATDGIFRVWIDGTLVFQRTDVPAGNLPFDQWEIFATWPNVPQAQCEYMWDALVWVPKP